MPADLGPDLAPPAPGLRACVVIPARDEGALIGECLRALGAQRADAGPRLDPRIYEVIVLANNCTDDTAGIARRRAEATAHGPPVHVIERDFPAEVAHVGTARRWVMDLACARLEAAGGPRALIASTDADSRVGPTWVAAQLAEVDAGADAVAGLIRVEAAELRTLGPAVRAAYRRDRLYRRLRLDLEGLVDPNPLDPRPGHDFHGGASLAITPSMYRRVGGLPPLRSLEDVALVEALWKLDARLVHSRGVRVATSSRLVGRAEAGHSSDLARWAAGSVAAVPDVAAFEAGLIARRDLRRLFEGGRPPDPGALGRLARRLGVEPTALAAGLGRGDTFGSWLVAVAELQAGRAQARPGIPIAVAIAHLRARIKAWRAAPQDQPPD